MAPALRIPRRWLLANISGALLSGGGLYCSQTGAPGWLTLSLLLTGLPLMLFSLARILGRAHRLARGERPAPIPAKAAEHEPHQ